MLIPTAVAIQWVDVTTPKVPSISGLVVNGSGLMLLIGIHCWAGAAGRAQLTTAEAACQPARCTALLASLCSCSCGGGVRRTIGGLARDAAGPRSGLVAGEGVPP